METSIIAVLYCNYIITLQAICLWFLRFCANIKRLQIFIISRMSNTRKRRFLYTDQPAHSTVRTVSLMPASEEYAYRCPVIAMPSLSGCTGLSESLLFVYDMRTIFRILLINFKQKYCRHQFNLNYSLGKFCRRQKWSPLLRKQVLTFHANCQIVSKE